MIPNNKYYKDIAVILGYEWDNKHHSSLVYMKEIAMAYGYSYETTKPSNKFLKDWHTGLTGETPSDHKYNLYYLRGIAEFLGSSTGLNENQCLAYIKDNIENPPTPSEFDSIVLTVTTPILSYADGDSTSLSAQLMNGQEEAHLSGKSIQFNIVDGQGTVISTIGSGTTDSNGTATCTYTSQGVGDIKVDASVDNRSISSEIFSIQDCKYWNDGSSVGSLEIGSGAICTSNGSYITLTTNTSGEKDVKLPVNLTGNWEFTTEVAELGTPQDITFKVGSGSQWGAADHTVNRITVNLGNGSTYYTKTISKDDTLKVTYVNGVMSVYWNDEYLTSRTVSISGKMGYYQVSGRTSHIKNIKLKPL